jgi:hypothetical protein
MTLFGTVCRAGSARLITLTDIRKRISLMSLMSSVIAGDRRRGPAYRPDDDAARWMAWMSMTTRQ